MRYCWLLLILLLSAGSIRAQEGYISGIVTDSITNEPLAFVSIVYNTAGHGVVTNLDGLFRIPFPGNVQFIKLRYIGYHTKTIPVGKEGLKPNERILLRPFPQDIEEVIVYPTENPAHRIIKKASENRVKNNPEKSGPFSYIAYEKVIFGIESDTSLVKGVDTTAIRRVIDDSLNYGMDGKSRIDIRRFLEDQYLFMMENVSSRKYFSAEKNKEEVIASRVSGVSQPSFMVLARQFQSFSFYENFINITDRQYLNPISTGSTEKYFFEIRDSVFTSRSDTVFIISFRPMRGKNFEGLKGVLYINSHGYAIQNVIAEAAEQKGVPVSVSIQQQYDLVNGVRWFPVLLNTTIRINPSMFGFKGAPVNLAGSGKSYIVNIDFNPKFNPSEFSEVGIEVKPDSHKQPEQVWSLYRTDSLTRRELETYRVIDSLGKAEHLDRTIISFETLLTGYLPGKYWNFDIRRFVGYNPYEGFRLGAGGKTSSALSDLFSVSGYVAYGTRDKSWKYSGGVTFNLHKATELNLTVLYRDDVKETGGITFNETWTISGTAFFRDYMVDLMDRSRDAELNLNFRALKYLTVLPYIRHSTITPSDRYDYEPDALVNSSAFSVTETGIKFRYAYKETFVKSPRGNKFSLGTNYPVIFLNYARAGDFKDEQYNYSRSEIKITKIFKTRALGDTRIAFAGGWFNGIAPYSLLYSGIASYRPFTLETEQSFGTMRFNEFLSDQFAALFLKQDFGKLLFKPRGKFQPEIALVQNIGFGSLENKPVEDIIYKTMEEGYYEGGILINNIFRFRPLEYGIGALYRYGPYAYQKTIDNFAFKLTIQLSL